MLEPAATLHQDVESIAVLIERPPEITTLAVDSDEYFVEEPRIAWPSLPLAQGSSIGASELETPLPDRLVADSDSTLGQEIFDIPEAQAETVIQPHGVGDDLTGITVACGEGEATKGVVGAGGAFLTCYTLPHSCAEWRFSGGWNTL